MKTLKVVLTGGPCGGKTTSIQNIEQEFTEKGYKVLIVPEAATILINSGIKPFGEDKVDIVEFQRSVIDLQLKLEEIAENTAKKSEKETIILCDRGIIDDKAYIAKEEFQKLLAQINRKELDIMESYDLVIHLKTAADGKEEFYTLDNNTARTETIEEAREKDKKTLEAWLGHEKLKIIGNETNFKEKMSRTIYEIYSALKKPYPIQRQNKYLVEEIDLNKLKNTKLVKLEVEQYIISDGKKDIMYRKTTKDGETKYTIKTKIDTNINSERIITERKITEEEYYESIPKEEQPIIKTRYCFAYKNEYFKLDVFNNNLKILEVEETNKTKEIKIPKFIKVKKDITDDVSYRNSSLFKKINNKSKVLEK